MTTGGARGSEPAPTLELDCDGSPVLVQAHDVVVGRVAKCTVRVTHPLVSREHCRFEPREDGLFVVDLGSVNGTWVNGERVAGRVQVRKGDKVGLGRDGAVLVVRSAVVGIIDVARLPREEDMRTMVAGDARARGVIARVDVAPDALPALGAADETNQAAGNDATAPTRQAAVGGATTAAQSVIPIATVLRSTDHAAPADASHTIEVRAAAAPAAAAPAGGGFAKGFAVGMLIGIGVAALVAASGVIPRGAHAAPGAREAAPK